MLRRGQPLEAALDGAVRDLSRSEDRAFARAIASNVCRHLVGLDALIDGATRQRLPHDAKARMVLRLALVQSLAMATPPHAAIATALPLVEGGPRRLVHGVLGAVLRGGKALPDPPLLPSQVERRWLEAWGGEMITDAQAALAEQPPIGLSFKDGRHETVEPGTDVTVLPGYADGEFWVQNVSATAPARMLGDGRGRTVLDLCAAPGGKTMQLAAAGWSVMALDISAGRLERLHDNLTRTRLEAKLVEADMLSWTPETPVDAILLDAPCSATGIFARHPDVLLRVRVKDIAALADLQRKMIARAARWLKPGGVFVYATCSLERDEGEGQAEAFEAAGLRPEWHERALPRPGVDGFSTALLRRA